MRLSSLKKLVLHFKNADGEEIRFEGFMNGLRDEIQNNQRKVYVIDFTSKSVRENEMVFINKSFKNQSPETIVREMVEKLSEKTRPLTMVLLVVLTRENH